ncbi:CAB2 [Candida pseudojiufengensis]|uniref:CAB2 n=1 Tax=Candida pseudojiufengensis TaxID=497109 RepID=UPI00222577B5|nr:CAB2 [Candida pseudojiufengensis]KAI5961645.1 CAB2 [Candida pseudojiufengensis]
MTPPAYQKNFHTSNPEASSAIDRSLPEFAAAELTDEDKYFKNHQPPSYLPEIEKEVLKFIKYHQKNTNKRIALVTSGGTTVPLENNTVRFIDNFSAGTRGATSAEYFLENNYAVIFLHREFSLLPYSRHFSHSTNCFLDFMIENNNKIEINPKFSKEMLEVYKKYNQAQISNSLLLIPFTTVNQYLYTLKLISESLKIYSNKVVFYLAAAVSDFFIPQSRMPQHKIQSSATQDGELVIRLAQVPKFLSRLVSNWTSGAMIISFKLETDNAILIKKAKSALERYHHQLVIGNLLQTRKKEVVFVSPIEEDKWIKLTDEELKNGKEIESEMIPAVISLHDKWIEKTSK